MGKLTQIKPYHQRGKKTQKYKNRKRMTQKGSGQKWDSFLKSWQRTDAIPMKKKASYIPFWTDASWTRSKFRRLRGSTGFVDKTGKVVTRSRSERGKRFFGSLTDKDIANLKKHRADRIEAMNHHVKTYENSIKFAYDKAYLRHEEKMKNINSLFQQGKFFQLKKLDKNSKKQFQKAANKAGIAIEDLDKCGRKWNTSCDSLKTNLQDALKRLSEEKIIKLKEKQKKAQQTLQKLKDKVKQKKEAYDRTNQKLEAIVNRRIRKSKVLYMKMADKMCRVENDPGKCYDRARELLDTEGLNLNKINQEMRNSGFQKINFSEKSLIDADSGWGIGHKSAVKRRSKALSRGTYENIVKQDERYNKFTTIQPSQRESAYNQSQKPYTAPNDAAIKMKISSIS